MGRGPQPALHRGPSIGLATRFGILEPAAAEGIRVPQRRFRPHSQPPDPPPGALNIIRYRIVNVIVSDRKTYYNNKTDIYHD